MEFKISDRVKAFGQMGQIVNIEMSDEYPIKVAFEGTGDRLEFSLDGKSFKVLDRWQLRLIRRFPEDTEQE